MRRWRQPRTHWTSPSAACPAATSTPPDGAFAYVTNNVEIGTVSVIETASNTVVATVPVGGAPRGVAVTPDGAFVYVANSDSGTVAVIETASNTVVAVFPVVVGG